jgi:hypothetical protein
LAFLTNFWSKIPGCNSKYKWGNVKGVFISGNSYLIYFYSLNYCFRNY